MDDKKKEFDADVDLDSLISYFNSDSDKKTAETNISVNKEAIKKNSQEKKKILNSHNHQKHHFLFFSHFLESQLYTIPNIEMHLFVFFLSPFSILPF